MVCCTETSGRRLRGDLGVDDKDIVHTARGRRESVGAS